MKIEVLQENFSKSLYIASRFTSSKVQLPVLANLLLKAEKNRLLIAATNLETSISLYIGIKVEEEGEITVPARTLNELVSNIRAGQLKIDVEKEKINIKSEGFESSVLGMNSSDFPKIPLVLPEDNFKIQTEFFSQALSQILFAVSQDETRPALTGVLIICSKGKLTLVSTDGFRLSQKIISVPEVKTEFKLILPKNALGELTRLFAEAEDIGFSFNDKENQVLFGVSNAILASRVIEGDFPDFKRIIPTSSLLNIYLDKDELLRAVKLASVFARDAANVVKFSVLKDSIEVLAESSQSGSQKTKVDAKVEDVGGVLDKEFVIAFNFRFLEDFLNSLNGDDIKIGLTDPNSPVLFLDTSDKEYMHIIMPVRLQT
ncbi:DNA polymerase III subunit beta [Candidatus Woesebacteria bacterium RIFCSPLOWO2_01_FULL_37_19]|uniref:Beta sliding clamp n=2 Tax=Candidatus Woeseibacteriota TaxID=1752722 RepID=A0A1F8AY02_9BACT|nr:MAG: DNA polymerase III subunit beta [Candidatus Woesebacteria bacterium RIFCSPHIGHO2_01_FULL_38_26b]OGM56606.1 MAG: DNA polymerase III subunit beta [Candidatus Woesebacteria bacterium RIFCSPLOWO2_01_FULL_37_19]